MPDRDFSGKGSLSIGLLKFYLPVPIGLLMSLYWSQPENAELGGADCDGMGREHSISEAAGLVNE